VITVRRLHARAFALLRHGLAGPGAADVVDATKRSAGLYGTSPTCYLGYAARIPGFRLADLDEQLYERRSLVRLRSKRESTYIEPVEWLPTVAAATEAGDSRAFRRIVKLCGLDDAAFEALAARIEAALEGAPPATVAELRRRLGGDVPGTRQALQYSVALLCRQCRLVRSEVRGGYRSNVFAYARWVDWVGAPLTGVDVDAARDEMARWYLRAYGPATRDDLKWWAGWRVRDTKATLERLGPELTEVTIDEADGSATPAVLLTEDRDAMELAPERVSGVRLLPVWDAWFMGYRDRRGQFADADRDSIYDASGNGTSVVIVDGVAAAIWEMEHPAPGRGLTIRVAPFRGSTVPWDDVEAAAAQVALAVGETELTFDRAGPAGRLADGARNAYLSPIRLGPGGGPSES